MCLLSLFFVEKLYGALPIFSTKKANMKDKKTFDVYLLSAII